MTDQNQPTLHNDELLKLMRQREEREAKRALREEAKLAAEEARIERLTLRRMEGDQQDARTIAARQARCDHRKGTTGAKKFKVLDYMMSRYTFQNGLTRIKCDKCRFKWFPGDTAELASGTMDNYLAKGKKIPNPTKLSYAQAWAMTNEDNTTNTPGRAEMVTQAPVPQFTA